MLWPISLLERPPVESTLDLLKLPWAFSQTRLLDDHQFEREAKDRGLHLWDGQLEQLHRRGLLVPFFRMWSRPSGPPRNLMPDLQEPGVVWQVYNAAAEGRLSDPSVRPFRRWPQRRSERGILYSEYQLLTVRQLAAIASVFKASRSDDSIEWDLAAAPKAILDVMVRSRALVVALELLAPRYRPRILSVIRSPSDRMYPFIDASRPLPAWSALTSDPDVLVRQAEHLLRGADSFDPLGKWQRVARIAAPRRWSELRYDALVAMEFRFAAEHLLMLREDLADSDLADPMPPVSTTWREARHSRLVVDARERAETLLDFRLTDHPAVVVALEGDTEISLAPRILGLMGMDERQGTIQLVNLKSVDGDVRLLARAVAVPRIDPEGYRGARVLRPLTALMIAVDQEKAYATPSGCETVKRSVVDELLSSLPPSVRTLEMRSDLEYLVHVRTWGEGGPFEFAHFTDAEIARAIKKLTGATAPAVRDLTSIVARHRAGDRNVESIWRKWRSVKITKPQLADALWPVLERRLLAARTRRPVPIGDVLAEAVRLAQEMSVVRELRTKEDQ